MSYKNKRILWKAIDGREFMVDTSNCETMEDVQAEVARMRVKYDAAAPDVVAVSSNDPHITSGLPNEYDLPEDVRAEFLKQVKEALERDDPKRLN